VLFADVVGYTSLTEALDPEIVERRVASTFETLSAEAARYEGLVEKFAGDSMLVLFGVPQIHEDDPERAVRAALEMQAALGRGEHGLQLRIGIESGEVLVDQAHAASDRERMVTGDPVNTAARLQAAAEPGEVLVGPAAFAGSKSIVDYEVRGPIELKGKARAVPAWRAVSVQARRGGLRSPLGIESALVGRDPEIALLKEAVRRVTADRKPQLVTVVGAAGVGKSRLAWELEKYLDGLPETYIWRKGRSFAYGQTSLGALVEIIRSDAGLRDDAASDEAVRKMDARLDSLPRRLGDRERSVLRGLLGLTAMPKSPPDELFGAVTRYVEALGRLAPTVLVFEDIHWSDDTLLDFVESVARWADGPILMLCLARHELLERRPRWAGGIRNSTTLVLEPLDSEANVRMVQALTDDAIPARLSERIIEIADGNPLFTEELIRMFIDRGLLRSSEGRWELAGAVDSIEVPGSIQAVLSARLDALPGAEKVVAKDAAVVGRVFWDAIVATLQQAPVESIDDVLRSLRVKELVVPREPSRFAGADEFSFRHALIRDVAYEALPKRDRADKHLAVIAWAERELADRGGEEAELIAQHYLATIRYREEFSVDPAELADLRRRAYRAVVVARDRAWSLHEKAGATRWARIALQLATALDLDVMERTRAAVAFLDLGSGHWARDEALVVARTALEDLEAYPETSDERERLEALVRSSLAWVLLGQGQAGEARAGMETQLARLEAGEPSATRAWLLARIGWLAWRVGPAESGRPYLERALAEARASGSRLTEAWALHDLGVVAGQTGDSDAAADLIRQSLVMARDEGDHALIVRCFVNLPAMTMDNAPDWDELLAWIEEGLALVRRASDRDAEAWLEWQLQDYWQFRGEFARALDHCRSAIDVVVQQGDLMAASVRRVGQMWLEAHFGRWPAGDEGRDDEAAVAVAEEQYVGWGLAWRALRAWREDPESGLDVIRRELPTMSVEARTPALWGARMAYRVGDREALRITREKPGRGVAVSRIVEAWLAALDGDTATAPESLAEVAANAERLGYVNFAEMARADRALAAARAGRDPEGAVREAITLQSRLGIQPLIGAVPEMRWVDVEWH
jgi:class 3 adenylate cyclase/tetratricopeptide (TPR) repeat protein